MACPPQTHPELLCDLEPQGDASAQKLQVLLCGWGVPASVQSCCSWQGEIRKFSSFCIPCCISQFKDNARETQHSIHIAFLDFHAALWALCVQGIFGAVSIQAPYVDPSGCSLQVVLVPQCSSCCLQDLPPAAVPMDVFPHQPRADSACGAFSCLQAVLENSSALSVRSLGESLIPSLGTTALSAKMWVLSLVSHPDSPVSHSPVGTQVCLRGGLEYPWCPQCAVSVCENRAGV